MNIARYDIDNNKVICRVIPFYLRGRKLILLMEACAHPLKSIHIEFKKWALERMIEASTTSQAMSLQWYLTHVFQSLFIDKKQQFRIIPDTLSLGAVIYDKEEPKTHSDNTYLYNKTNDPAIEFTEQMILRYKDETENSYNADIIINAPKIQETAEYDNDNYINDIRKRVDKYMTTRIAYEIKIV